MSGKKYILIGAIICILAGIKYKSSDNSSIHKENTKVESTEINNEDLSGSDHSGLELPASLKDKRQETIIKHTAYTISFNKEWNIPNWVAWEMNPKKLTERESRTNDFLPDPQLSENIAVTTRDYIGSGYDRGHMCPAGDNKWLYRAMFECFYMTNICPQNHNLNTGDWNDLEIKCREWTRKYKRIYIVCGPIVNSDNIHKIGKQHKVVVPDKFFKCILCTASNPAKAIAFIYDNKAGHKEMESYACSVDNVEKITNIDFFAKLPDKTENAVEANYNYNLW